MQTKAITTLYNKAGLTPPKGKGEHKIAFHKCVISIKKKIEAGNMPEDTNPYAICMDSLGRNKAVNKSHWR